MCCEKQLCKLNFPDPQYSHLLFMLILVCKFLTDACLLVLKLSECLLMEFVVTGIKTSHTPCIVILPVNY